MEELFNWAKATDTFNDSYVPSTKPILGTTYIVMNLEDCDSTTLKPGMIVTFTTIATFNCTAYFTIEGATTEELLYWCQVKPTKETYEKYYMDNRS